MLQSLLRSFLIIPKIRRGDICLESLQLGTLRVRVKETSGVQLPGVSSPLAVHAIPVIREGQAFTYSFKKMGKTLIFLKVLKLTTNPTGSGSLKAAGNG